MKIKDRIPPGHVDTKTATKNAGATFPTLKRCAKKRVYLKSLAKGERPWIQIGHGRTCEYVWNEKFIAAVKAVYGTKRPCVHVASV